MKPPFIKVSGVFARPTCLNNVETLSLVPHLLLDVWNLGTRTDVAFVLWMPEQDNRYGISVIRHSM